MASSRDGNVLSIGEGSHDLSSQYIEYNEGRAESEPILPFIKPTGDRPRKYENRHMKPTVQALFPVTHNRRWIAGTHVAIVDERRPIILQRKSPVGHIQTVPSPAASSNLVVPNTAESIQEKGDTSQISQPTTPSRDEIAAILLACNTDEDYRRWIRWMVVPFSGKVGMTSSMGIEGQVKLFSELGYEMGEKFRTQGEVHQLTDGANDMPRDPLVTN
ncbi:hypothetical protein FRX31_008386 [Thalictrum thalictroides]|uniref:Uncharacterized protein n=1 Tax=Thalictrum thalictroides TaxID=46969 RepID=A0A7J6WX58_THATH|nr:hypothetical protein FRX31_008386 [Thalictrum thalictroides]